MRITWYGHAAFLIEATGLGIILDPYKYPEAGGYLPIDEPADVVAVSHENDRYHSHLGQIRPPFEVIRGLELPPGGVERDGVRFEAIPVFETPEKQAGDEVTILQVHAEGFHVAFLGDLGHALDQDEIGRLRGADVVLAPAGGPPTIGLAELRGLLEAIQPRFVVPMHYKTPKINLDILPIERFLEVMAGWPLAQTSGSSFELDASRTSGPPTIVCLEHAR